jgi:hypothetical protein
MIITYKEARELLAPYASKAGLCATQPQVALFVKEVIQELLFRGASGNLRKWTFLTETGTFTAPPDLELPVKVSIEDSCHFGHESAAVVFDKWYSFYDSQTLNDCIPAENGIVEEPNEFYTAFDPPYCGSRLLVVPHCEEDPNAQIIIQGLDENGSQIFMPHEGERNFSGEVLTINKASPKYTQKIFTKITGITKTPTKHYVRLYSYCPLTKKTEFLAQYKPTDTQPSFRRFRVLKPCAKCVKVTILGRIRFVENYHPNDIIPISNLRALKLMAQQIQAEDNDSAETANYKNQRVEQVLQNESNYKRTPQAPIDFFLGTAPSSVKNMI